MTPTIGSPCSGYGGLEMALGLWLGAVDVRWHAEIDPDASRALKTWWPEVPNLGDFTVPGWAAERVDIEAGGVPCQGFSAAGRQLGAADPRHLWPDWRRGIEARRPDMVVFENVANLTRGKMRPIFDSILVDLLELGYDVRWCLLGACAVGAAHHRHRVFLLARRTDAMPSVRQVEVQTCGQHAAAYVPTPVVTDARGARNQTSGRREGSAHHSGTTLGDMITLLPSPRAADSQRGGVDRERTEATGRKNGIELISALKLLPSLARGDGSSSGPNQGIASGDIALSSAVQPERWGKYAEAIARHEAVLGRTAPEPTEIGPRGGRRLAAAFSEWLMMLPAGHLTSILDRNPALARAGNGVVPLQAATALRLLDEAMQS